MKQYKGTFLKKNGETREMRFLRLSDLPKEFLDSKLKGGSNKKSKLSEGSELVWDIDSNGFRVFNWNSVQGNIEENEIEEFNTESAE
tara:strand:- start:254 stop:514 length:261 start_codon:yes stop_codon:yes gene_type:complete